MLRRAALIGIVLVMLSGASTARAQAADDWGPSPTGVAAVVVGVPTFLLGAITISHAVKGNRLSGEVRGATIALGVMETAIGAYGVREGAGWAPYVIGASVLTGLGGALAYGWRSSRIVTAWRGGDGGGVLVRGTF